MEPGSDTRRGFSLLEVLITLVIVGILSGVAVATYRFFTQESRTRGAESSLVSVAAAADSYHLSRGFWPAAASLDASGDGAVSVVSTPSTGPDTISLVAVDADGTAALGLAVRTDDGQCLTLLLLPPETQSSNESVTRRDLSEGEPCSGASA